jgi:hypothetical protein
MVQTETRKSKSSRAMHNGDKNGIMSSQQQCRASNNNNAQAVDKLSRDDTNSMEISHLETVFLVGHYDSALTLANQYLKRQQLEQKRWNDSSDKTPNCRRPLSMPLNLRFDVRRHTRYICWQLAERDESDRYVSQVAAISLQSWYELYKQEQQRTMNHQFDKGYRFLQPFLDTYTSIDPDNVLNCRAMSVELLVVFIRFLSSRMVGHEIEAMQLATEFLHQIRWTSSEQNCSLTSASDHACLGIVEETCCRELVLHFFTELVPTHCKSIITATELLNYLTSRSAANAPIVTAIYIEDAEVLNDYPRKDVLQQCLCYCNTDDAKWPTWLQDSFLECRIILQAKLREMYDRRTDHKDLRNLRNTGVRLLPESTNQRVHYSRRMDQSWMVICNSIRRFVSHQLHQLKKVISQKRMNSLTLHEQHRIQVTCLVVCLAIFSVHRYRNRISKTVQAALVVTVWRPIMEILQAIRP